METAHVRICTTGWATKGLSTIERPVRHTITEPRPDKDIAHDMLAKLPNGTRVASFKPWVANENMRWRWSLETHDSAESVLVDSFEEAVCALAERHLEQKP